MHSYVRGSLIRVNSPKKSIMLASKDQYELCANHKSLFSAGKSVNQMFCLSIDSMEKKIYTLQLTGSKIHLIQWQNIWLSM